LGLPAVLCVQQRDSEEIRRVLAAFQAPVRECVDGRGAIAAARSFPLFCAIVPLQMPDMGASALIGSLHAAAPGLAVLVVVDSPAVSEAVAVMRSGAHAVIDSRILSTGLMVHLAPLLRGR
jgi:DNA-binding NarL/FixJ family response regulator